MRQRIKEMLLCGEVSVSKGKEGDQKESLILCVYVYTCVWRELEERGENEKRHTSGVRVLIHSTSRSLTEYTDVVSVSVCM